MKYVIYFIMFVSIGYGQVGKLVDSVGVSSVYWQKIDVLNNYKKIVSVFNDTTVTDSTRTIYVECTLQSADTVSSRTRYRVRVYSGEVLEFITNERYVYIRGSEANVPYRVRVKY